MVFWFNISVLQEERHWQTDIQLKNLAEFQWGLLFKANTDNFCLLFFWSHSFVAHWMTCSKPHCGDSECVSFVKLSGCKGVSHLKPIIFRHWASFVVKWVLFSNLTSRTPVLPMGMQFSGIEVVLSIPSHLSYALCVQSFMKSYKQTFDWWFDWNL